MRHSDDLSVRVLCMCLCGVYVFVCGRGGVDRVGSSPVTPSESIVATDEVSTLRVCVCVCVCVSVKRYLCVCERGRYTYT